MESKVKQCEFSLLKHGKLLNFETADSVRTKWEDILLFQLGKDTETNIKRHHAVIWVVWQG